MAIPIINNWKKYYSNPHEGLGSSYERVVINNKLQEIVKRYEISSVLETPSFGFTGLSGMNLVDLAQSGLKITLEDDNTERIEFIRNLWSELQLSLDISYNPRFSRLAYANDSFDMAWNFSALWFVSDLDSYLTELARVTKKTIVICVPNQFGIGYKLQKHSMTSAEEHSLNLQNIDPERFVAKLYSLNWKLKETSLIDCPPWPDIGMNIEDFLQKYCTLCKLYLKLQDFLHLPGQRACKISGQGGKCVSILDYYKGKDPDFASRMHRFYWFERYLPSFIAKHWAHHRYFIFVPR